MFGMFWEGVYGGNGKNDIKDIRKDAYFGVSAFEIYIIYQSFIISRKDVLAT